MLLSPYFLIIAEEQWVNSLSGKYFLTQPLKMTLVLVTTNCMSFGCHMKTPKSYEIILSSCLVTEEMIFYL